MSKGQSSSYLLESWFRVVRGSGGGIMSKGQISSYLLESWFRVVRGDGGGVMSKGQGLSGEEVCTISLLDGLYFTSSITVLHLPCIVTAMCTPFIHI